MPCGGTAYSFRCRVGPATVEGLRRRIRCEGIAPTDSEEATVIRRTMILTIALALLIAACGGSGDEGVATLEDTDRAELDQSLDEATQGVDDEQALLAFGACMRENGVESFPDPSLSSDGSVEFATGGGDPFADVDNDTAEAAVNACIGELAGVSFAPGGSDFDLTEMQDAMVEFAACMRSNGIDFDDPDLSNFGFGDEGLSNPFGELDVDDPAVMAAIEECQSAFTGFGFGFGG